MHLKKLPGKIGRLAARASGFGIVRALLKPFESQTISATAVGKQRFLFEAYQVRPVEQRRRCTRHRKRNPWQRRQSHLHTFSLMESREGRVRIDNMPGKSIVLI